VTVVALFPPGRVERVGNLRSVSSSFKLISSLESLSDRGEALGEPSLFSSIGIKELKFVGR